MSKHVKHVPKHRSAPARPTLPRAPRKAIRTTVLLSSVAAAATGATISGGMLAGESLSVSRASADGAAQERAGAATAEGADNSGANPGDTAAEKRAATLVPEREQVVSRSAGRESVDPAKRAALATDTTAATVETEDLADSDPREIAKALLGDFGFGPDQFSCLDSLYTRESNWSITADNPTSSAYGIPQSLPGSKMASAGADWETNPVTQITWGLGYIQDRYGSPCGAWSHSQSNGWY